MHSAYSVTKTWYMASAYCNASSARLAKVSHNPDAFRFMSVLARRGNATNVWVGSSRSSHSSIGHYNSQHPHSGIRTCTKFNTRISVLTKSSCSKELPFICERGNCLVLCSLDLCVEILKEIRHGLHCAS